MPRPDRTRPDDNDRSVYVESMMNRIQSQRAAIVIAMALTIVIGARPSAAADSPVGKWNTVDDKSGKVTSEVQLYDQGASSTARSSAFPSRMTPQASRRRARSARAPTRTSPSSGSSSSRTSPRTETRYKGGTILDPDDGKVYKSEIWQEGGKLKGTRRRRPLFRDLQTWVKGQLYEPDGPNSGGGVSVRDVDRRYAAASGTTVDGRVAPQPSLQKVAGAPTGESRYWLVERARSASRPRSDAFIAHAVAL